ncbi:transposase [Streptomyces mirabilis]|uniref:transposase n=1 Tax=Streptomyces mirabilis TaxID=68239 RepID=UPI0033B3CB93
MPHHARWEKPPRTACGTCCAGLYTGTAGRLENSQVAVHLVYAGASGHVTVDPELYVPGSWTTEPRPLPGGRPRRRVHLRDQAGVGHRDDRAVPGRPASRSPWWSFAAVPDLPL